MDNKELPIKLATKFGILFCSIIFGLIILYQLLIGLKSIDEKLVGLILFVALFGLYWVFRRYTKNLLLFFILLFSCIWLIPTIQYWVYENNNNTYLSSDTFKSNISTFVNEKIDGKLSVNDIDVIINNLLSDSNRIVFFDNLIIDSIYKIDVKSGFGLKQPDAKVIISKGDSLQTILHFSNSLFLTSKNLVQGLLNEKDRLQFLTSLKSVDMKIPYNQFVVEAFFGFVNGDISPTRNIPKVLAQLQIFLLLILTSFIFNSFGDLNLGFKAKSKQKKDIEIL